MVWSSGEMTFKAVSFKGAPPRSRFRSLLWRPRDLLVPRGDQTLRDWHEIKQRKRRHQDVADPWTTEGLGHTPPTQSKNHAYVWLPPNLTTIVPQYPGDWFQDPLWLPKSTDAQVPFIKSCRTMCAVGSHIHRFPPADQK